MWEVHHRTPSALGHRKVDGLGTGCSQGPSPQGEGQMVHTQWFCPWHFSYVWEHLDIGYVQGMCDLLAPLLVILDNGEGYYWQWGQKAFPKWY